MLDFDIHNFSREDLLQHFCRSLRHGNYHSLGNKNNAQLKVGLSPHKKICFIYFNRKPLKMIKMFSIPL